MFFLSEVICDVPHGHTSWLRWQIALPSGVAILTNAILHPSLNYWMFLFYQGLSELTFLTVLTRKVHLPFETYSSKICTQKSARPNTQLHHEERDRGINCENTPWTRVFTLATEMQLGITCLKLEDGKQNIAVRVVKTQGTKHHILNSKITSLNSYKWVKRKWVTF